MRFSFLILIHAVVMALLVGTILSVAAAAAQATQGIEVDAAGWKPIPIAFGRFVVSMPGEPDIERHAVDAPDGEPVTGARYELRTDLFEYCVSTHTLPPGMDGPGELFGDANTRVDVQMRQAKLLARRTVRFNNSRGRELDMLIKGQCVRTQDFVVDGQLVQLSLTYQRGERDETFEATSKRFFGSLQVRRP